MIKTALPFSDPDTIGYPSGRVNGERLWQRMAELATIGATPLGGVHRPALSEAETAARLRIIDWSTQIGLVTFADPIGNLFLRLAGTSDGAEPVLTGSYLDTQPNGGKYSGSFGMLAALEAIAAIAKMNRRPARPIIAVAWMNGEGTRFNPGYMGSEVFAGRRSLTQTLKICDAAGKSVADALRDWQTAVPELPQAALGFPCAAYVETHLEQGPVLEENRRQIGIVTALQGVRRFQVRVIGEAAHAGTMPRRQRRDALSATVRIIGALENFCAAPDVLFTVSQLSVEPNAPSVVPSATTFSVDIRHQDDAVLARLGDTIRLICESEKGPCDFTMTENMSNPSTTFHDEIQSAVATAARRLNLSAMPLVSLGGHDAKSLARHCPSGIIFIPCRNGLSHNEAESIAPEAATAGAKVLADVLWGQAMA